MDEQILEVYPAWWEGGTFIFDHGPTVQREIISLSNAAPLTTGPRAPLSINLRAAVLARDGLVCQLCGNPIRYQSNIAIDHIIPVSKGGPDTLDNLRVAHRFCNSRRNNREWTPHCAGPDIYDRPRPGEQPLQPL